MRTIPGARRRSIVSTLSLAFFTVAVAGLGKFDWWLCDLLANFRVHAIVASISLLPLLIYDKRRLLLPIAVAAIATNVFAIVGLERAAPTRQGHSQQELVVVSFNLGPGTGKKMAASAFLEDTTADIIIFQEYTHFWHERLQTLLDRYPHSATEPREGSFGIALYSRHPILASKIAEFPQSKIPYILAETRLANRTIGILGVHLQWPGLPSLFAERNRQIKNVIDITISRNQPLVACGDWNLTPWSGWYRQLVNAGLRDGKQAFRNTPTWPAPLQWLGIPIDHCFATRDLMISEIQAGPWLDSDHRPIRATVTFDAFGTDSKSKAKLN